MAVKINVSNSDKILGRVTAGSGEVEELDIAERTFTTGDTKITIKTNGIVQSTSSTFTNPGNVTGNRYYAQLNGTIYTSGGGANYFPGTAAGSTATGGQYA